MNWREIEKVQPLTNIGTAGHVDNGKTTLVEALTGKWTAYFSDELKRGITLKLGYADCTILKCPECPEIESYTTEALNPEFLCKRCGSNLNVERKISIVDVPGHESLMVIMLSGATLMDGALLVVDASRNEPLPQTKEHFKALEIIGVRNIVVVQNKIDITPKDKIIENYKHIKEFLEGTWAENAPIIPVSALHKINIDVLLYAIQKFIPTPKRDPSKPARMLIARSFDVNKPGTPPEKLVGGVVGGTLIQGRLRVGDEVEIKPGIAVKRHGKVYIEPIYTEVTSLKVGEVSVNEAYPGGLLGVGTSLDPALTKRDSLVGQMLGEPGKLPPTRQELSIEVHLFKHVVAFDESVRVERVKTGEMLMINIGTAAVEALVTNVREGGMYAELKLTIPVCAEKGMRVAISRRIPDIFGRGPPKWRLIGWGLVTD